MPATKGPPGIHDAGYIGAPNPLIGSKSCTSADAPDFFRIHGIQVMDRAEGHTQRMDWWKEDVGGFGVNRTAGSVGVGNRQNFENAGRDSAVSADAPAFFKGKAIPINRHM